jgi:hypothetical protein
MAEQDQILDFFSATHRCLDYLSDDPHHLLPESLLDSYRDAWIDVRELVLKLQNTVKDSWHNLAGRFKELGLAGRQLQFKSELLQYRLVRWIRPRVRRRALLDLLHLLAAFFGSLGRELPGAEVIKEFIEYAINALTLERA